jgi:hypothetical protein
VKLTCVIINRNNFRARIFNQIQIPASETSRSLGSLFEINLWASLGNSIKRGELAIENVPPDEGRLVKFPWAPLDSGHLVKFPRE